MMCGRKLLMFLLVFCSSFLLFSQESKPTEMTNSPNQTPILFDPWSNIDLTLNLLEEQTNDMQIRLEKQTKRIKNLENAYQNTYLLYLNSEAKSQRLEQDMSKCKKSLRNWRIVGISSLVVITVVGVVTANDAR